MPFTHGVWFYSARRRPRFLAIYPDSLGRRKALAKRVELDSFEGMIRPGFLLGDERSALIALARDGSVTHRLARRANALVLLDDGLSCEQVARVLCWTTTRSVAGMARLPRAAERR